MKKQNVCQTAQYWEQFLKCRNISDLEKKGNGGLNNDGIQKTGKDFLLSFIRAFGQMAADAQHNGNDIAPGYNAY